MIEFSHCMCVFMVSHVFVLKLLYFHEPLCTFQNLLGWSIHYNIMATKKQISITKPTTYGNVGTKLLYNNIEMNLNDVIRRNETNLIILGKFRE